MGFAVLGGVMGAAANTVALRLYKSEPPGRAARNRAAALVTAALFALLSWRIGVQFELVPYAVLAVVCVLLAMIDVAEQRLPSPLVLPLYPLLLVLFGAIAILRQDGASFVRAVGGGLAVGGFLLLLAMVFAGQLGAGDVKLGGVLGIAAGWISWPAVWLTAFVAILLALAFQLGQCVLRRPRAALAFGPFLAAGLFTVVALAAW